MKSFILILLTLLGPGLASGAEIEPSSHLLVPWFEVDLTDPVLGPATLFAVCNHGTRAVSVTAAVHTNWGISLFTTGLVLKPGELRTFNLRDWIVSGALPDRRLTEGELAHVQAALTGETSPRTGLYYGSPFEMGMAVGYVTVNAPAGLLWGDFYQVDGRQGSFLAGALVDLETDGACRSHGVRFLNDPAVAGETRLLVWTGRRGTPSATPQPERVLTAAYIEVYDEPGRHVEDHMLSLLSADTVEVGDLALRPDFGWLEIETSEPSFLFEHVRTLASGGAVVQSWCLTEETWPDPKPAASLALEARVQGQEADVPPGPVLSTDLRYVQFTYDIENTGQVPIFDIAVTDTGWQGIGCPKRGLSPGESMTCHSIGAVIVFPGQYSALTTVTGWTPWDETVSADDPIYYYGAGPSLSLVKLTNGLDVSGPPGPSIPVGAPVTWQYVVTNTGPRSLGFAVTDDQGVQVSCPTSFLMPGHMVVCTASGTAQAGQYKNVGTVKAPLSPMPGEIAVSDASWYLGVPE